MVNDICPMLIVSICFSLSQYSYSNIYPIYKNYQISHSMQLIILLLTMLVMVIYHNKYQEFYYIDLLTLFGVYYSLNLFSLYLLSILNLLISYMYVGN